MGQVRVIAKKIDWKTLGEEFGNLLPTLYCARREAVERLRNKKAKLSSMTTGLLLQEIVEKELGITSGDLVICKGEQGKPYIEGHPNFHFNISHSSDMVAIAYGDSPVGVDVEHIKCRENDLKVAKRCFTEEEYAFITDEAFGQDLDGIGRCKEERFFMVWTMKEAYLKYKGTGINVPLNSFQVKPYDGAIEGEELIAEPVVINDYVYTVCVDKGVEVTMCIE